MSVHNVCVCNVLLYIQTHPDAIHSLRTPGKKNPPPLSLRGFACLDHIGRVCLSLSRVCFCLRTWGGLNSRLCCTSLGEWRLCDFGRHRSPYDFSSGCLFQTVKFGRQSLYASSYCLSVLINWWLWVFSIHSDCLFTDFQTFITSENYEGSVHTSYCFCLLNWYLFSGDFERLRLPCDLYSDCLLAAFLTPRWLDLI